MIQILRDYYDIKGKRYKVLKFSTGKYLCEGIDGNKKYLSSNELFTNEQLLNMKKTKPKEQVVTPNYVFEQQEKDEHKKIEPDIVEDNYKEMSEQDFYADL